jgi:sulfur carrier protein
MQVIINQQETELQTSTLSGLVNELQLPDVGIAIAVNQQIIPRQLWESTQLIQNDHITIIRATRGG